MNVIGFDQDLEKVNIARKLGITSFNASDNNQLAKLKNGYYWC